MLAIHQVAQIIDVLEEDLELNLTPVELLACSVNVQAALSRDCGYTYAEMTNLGATGHAYGQCSDTSIGLAAPHAESPRSQQEVQTHPNPSAAGHFYRASAGIG